MSAPSAPNDLSTQGPSDHPLKASQQQRRLIVRLVRMSFFILITTVALVSVIQRASERGVDQPAFTALPPVTTNAPHSPDSTAPSGPIRQPAAQKFTPEVEVAWWVPVAIAVGLFSVVVLIDLATPNKKIASISAVLFGLLAGVVATVAISAVIELALQVWLPPRALEAIRPLVQLFKPLMGIALCYLGITTVLQTQDDFRLVIPYVEFAKQIRGTKPFVLDTSALIDARIADLTATGLLQAPIIIPRFVISELQTLADSSDKMKRTRGRRGLEIVTRLQRQGTVDVTIDESPVVSRAVDQMLVELAEHLTARIVTTDLGLSRVAQIKGVVVINMHEIATACKPALIPGEQLIIKLIKPGEQPGQGVGYLDDGTMVVVDNAATLIGQEAAVQVTSSIQTAGGRMVFGRIPAPAKPADAVADSAPAPSDPPPAAADEPPPAPADSPLIVKSHSGDWTVEHDGGVTPEPAPAQAATSQAAGTPAHTGPFPPKQPARKPPSLRNPRR